MAVDDGMTEPEVVSKAPQSVEARFDWQAREYGEVVQHLTKEKFRSTGWRVGFLAGGGVVLWQILQLADYVGETGNVLAGLISLLPWALLLAFLIWISTHGAGWQASRRVKKLDPRVGNEQVHRVSPQGLFVDTGAGSVELPWSSMSKVEETPRHFLWYWHQEMAHYTPKRALPADDVRQVRELIRQFAPEQSVR